MNIYRQTFYCACPNNGRVIKYKLKIRSKDTILVEHIQTACALFKSDFHEKIADELFRRFGGKQTIKAKHHGTPIETRRGWE